VASLPAALLWYRGNGDFVVGVHADEREAVEWLEGLAERHALIGLSP